MIFLVFQVYTFSDRKDFVAAFSTKELAIEFMDNIFGRQLELKQVELI